MINNSLLSMFPADTKFLRTQIKRYCDARELQLGTEAAEAEFIETVNEFFRLRGKTGDKGRDIW